MTRWRPRWKADERSLDGLPALHAAEADLRAAVARMKEILRDAVEAQIEL